MDQDDPLVKQRATTNPYRIGLGLILQRLVWDLSLQSHISRYRLRKQKDRYSGRAIILCNGPSLNSVDFELLSASGIYCFGLNKINLLFERTSFRPDSIVAVNSLVIEQNAEYYNATSIPLYLDSSAHQKAYVKPRKNIIFLHSSGHQKFAKDVSLSMNQGHTVTVAALQIAFHLGFEKVAIVGADHNFATKGPANKTVISGEKDESHFDPNYFAGGVKWQLPDLFESEVWYGRARQMYEAHNREIINCTDGGKLEVFTRQPLIDFLK